MDSKVTYMNTLRNEPLPGPAPSRAPSRGLVQAPTEAPAEPQDSTQAGLEVVVSEEQNKELGVWKKRYQAELGELTSSPALDSQPTAKAEQVYLNDLVDQLAGKELKEKNIDLKIEVFSGNLPQIALDDTNERELEWEKKHPGQEWPMRTLLHSPDGNAPIYRLVLTEGMLHEFETREELAFVVATELEKLFKHHAADPNNEKQLECNTQSWFEPRETKITTDSAAIGRMCRANLNPSGAMGALEKLYAKYPPEYPHDDQKAALTAVAQIQEHEGIRIAAVQAQLEYLRRSGEPATQQTTELLPKGQFGQASGKYESDLADLSAFKSAVNHMADELSSEQTPEWMFTNRKPPQIQLLLALGPSHQDYESALVGICDSLSHSDKSPQQKVNGLLRTLYSLSSGMLAKPISAATQETVVSFLESNQGWKADDFNNGLSNAQGKSLHRSVVQDLLQNEAFQNLMGPLAEKSPELKRLFGSAASSYVRSPENGQVDVEALPVFLKANNREDRIELPFNAAQNSGALEFLSAQDPKALAAASDECGLPQGLVLCNDLRAIDGLHPDFVGQLRQTMEPIQKASNEVREDNARLRLRPPLTEPAKVSLYLQELFESEVGQAFSAEFEQQLPGILKDVVLTCNHQADMVYDGGRPRSLVPGLERRICQGAVNGTAEDKKEFMRFLSRQWGHELHVPTHSQSREWTKPVSQALASLPTEELVAQLTTPTTADGQYDEQLRKTLIDGFCLTPEALPDTKTESLRALNVRRQNGEFKPKRENFASQAEFDKANAAYNSRCETMKGAARFLAPAESRLVLSKLAILGHDSETSLKVASQLNLEQFQGILSNTEQALDRSKAVRSVCTDVELEALGADGGTFLMDGFMAVEKQIPDLETFYGTARRTVAVCPLAIEARSDTKNRFADSLYQRLGKLEEPELRQWLGRDNVLDVLRPEQTSELILRLVGGKADPSTAPAELGSAIRDLDKSYRLQEKHPLAYSLVRDTVTEKAKLQPNTLNEVFPPDPANPVEKISHFQGQIAGLSGLVAMARNHSAIEQFNTLEYLMGRSDEMPAYLEKATETQNVGPLTQSLRNARQALTEAEPEVRTMVANSFLAGPNGLMDAPGGRETIMDYVLSGVNPKYLRLAKPMIQAILFSQGDADSLAVAIVLGQKPKKEGAAKLGEADIMNKIFDSYGVPGIKMKQYLAFTSQFEHFREAFESAQDAANPLNYYEVLRLIQKRFGDEWPADLQIDKILGSGSVNVAIRYNNKEKGTREVVSLGRENIVEATRYDFERFNKFVDALTSSPEGAANFGFIRGLVGIIEDSVKLEFDKESAKKVQQQANRTYLHEFPDGWKVRSIDAFEVKHLGLFMEEAKGKTARKTLGTNPGLYKEAMRHMADAEFRLLKGQDSSKNLQPRPNFANPDFHDGQVMIDEKAKTVTILDFGQAVPITNEERETALDLLTVLGHLDTSKQGLRRLNQRFFADKPDGGLTKEDLKFVWGAPKKMDSFIRLLAAVSQKGGKVPLSTVHWVLALNRQFVLGAKLDQPIEKEVVGMVVNHKLGMKLGSYNTIKGATEKVTQWAGNIGHCLGSWAFKAPEPPKEGEGTVKAMGTEGQYTDVIDMISQQAKPEPLQPKKKSSFGWYPEELLGQ